MIKHIFEQRERGECIDVQKVLLESASSMRGGQEALIELIQEHKLDAVLRLLDSLLADSDNKQLLRQLNHADVKGSVEIVQSMIATLPSTHVYRPVLADLFRRKEAMNDTRFSPGGLGEYRQRLKLAADLE